MVRKNALFLVYSLGGHRLPHWVPCALGAESGALIGPNPSQSLKTRRFGGDKTSYLTDTSLIPKSQSQPILVTVTIRR